MTISPGLLSALALGSTLAVAAGALAADAVAAEAPPEATSPAPLAVEVTGQCPSREAVVTALLPVLGADATNQTQEAPRVSDLGDRFEIAALGHTQQYVDPGRDCAERARVAAVYIALALNPPQFQPRATPPPAAAVEAPRVPPAPPAASASSGGWAGFALAARVDGGSGDGDSSSPLFAAGAELRAAAGWRALGLVASAGLLSPTTSRFQSVSVRQQRFPFSLAATGRRELSHAVAASAAVGVALVPFTLRGDGLDTSTPATRLDAGAHFALALELPPLAGRMIPFVDVHADYFPRPYVIAVDPLGDVGSTGHLWVGVSLGLALEARP